MLSCSASCVNTAATALHRHIRSQFEGKRKIPFVATDHEVSHGRDIIWTLRSKEAPEHIQEAWSGTSWIVDLTADGTRDGKPFHATHLFITSLRTKPVLATARQRYLDRLLMCLGPDP